MKKYLWSICMCISAITVFAQKPKVSIPLCTNGTVCMEQNQDSVEVCVNFTVPVGHCGVKSYVIVWAKNDTTKHSAVSAPISNPTIIVHRHKYGLKDFVANCSEYEMSLYIRPITINASQGPTDDRCEDSDFSNLSEVTIRKPPKALFKINNPVACINQPVNFSIQNCPAGGNPKYEFDYGDGTKGTTPNHVYLKEGNFSVVLKVWNDCTTQDRPVVSAPQVVRIIGLPKPVILDSGAIRSTKDTIFICPQNGVIQLNGLDSSKNVTSLSWSTPGGQIIKGDNRSPKLLIRYTKPGVYSITLTVKNACDIEKEVRVFVRVLDLSVPTLPKQADTCAAFIYRIKFPILGAVYRMNGKEFDPITGVLVEKSDNPNIVDVSIMNICGSKPVSDTFFVRDTPTIQILAFGGKKDITLCGNNEVISLTTDQAGAKWLPSPLIKYNGTNPVLDLKNAGEGTLIAQVGGVGCVKYDSVRVKIISATAQVENEIICKGTKSVLMKRSRGLGKWDIKNCPSCSMSGDTLIIGNSPPSSIELSFTAIAEGICFSNPATATVKISEPTATYQLPAGPYCARKKITIENTSQSESTTWIINNGITITTRNLELVLNDRIYSIELISKAGDCYAKANFKIEVLPQPIAQVITLSKNPICSGESVSVNLKGDEQKEVSYTLDYGNGNKVNRFVSVSEQVYLNTSKSELIFKISSDFSNGCDTKHSEVVLTVKPKAKAALGVAISKVICASGVVHFTDMAENSDPGRTMVDFGDGTPAVKAPGKLFSHLFENSDSVVKIFRVIYTVTSDCGNDADTVLIQVNPKVIKAKFNVSSLTPCINEKVYLQIASTDLPDQNYWRVDGDINWNGVGEKAIYVPKSAGKIRVWLVSIGCAGKDSTFIEIDVKAPTPGSFIIDNKPICVGSEVIAKNTTSPLSVKKIIWQGDPDIKDSLTFDFRRIYTKAGTYTLSLTVENQFGCISTTPPQTIIVRDKTKATFGIIGNSVICTDSSLTVMADLTTAAFYQWIDPKTNETIGAGPILNYKAKKAGQVELKLKVSDGVCPDSSVNVNVATVQNCTLLIPDVFTPKTKNDFINDYYTVFGEGISRIITMRIYSREGIKVFEKFNFDANRPESGWDGGLYDHGMYILEVEVEYLQNPLIRRKKRSGIYLVR